MTRKIFTQARHAFVNLGLLIHIMTFGYTVILPLLGAATVSPHLAPSQLFGLISVAFTYHIYAYVLNDLVDLPLDRTQPIRANYPLVRGSVRPTQALVFAVLQIPLAFLITAVQGASFWTYLSLGISFIFITIYDRWSKYTSFPPLTDLAQGLGWATFALYGALLVSDRINSLTLWLFVFEIVFILLINGANASLRDLENDLNSGGHTVAILLGVRPQPHGGVVFTRRFVMYALILKIVLIGITFAPLVRNDFGYSSFAWSVTFVAILAMAILSIHSLLSAVKATNTPKDLMNAGTLHLLIEMSIPIMWLALSMDWIVLVVLLIVYIGPMPFPKYDWVLDPLWRGWRVKGTMTLRAVLAELRRSPQQKDR